jgi:cyclopropane-fatty-acyl-phospholipid synthase
MPLRWERKTMAIRTIAAHDSFAGTSLRVLEALFGDAYLQNFAVELWDGTRIAAAGHERFTFCVNAPGALRAALARPVDLAAGRAFAAGLIGIQGDIETAVDTLFAASNSLTPLRTLGLIRLLRKLPKIALPPLREASLRGRAHSRERDRAAIGFHYDQPVNFYRTFLGRDLMYSCAYFDDGIETLDEAQTAKIDYILRKVRLKPGERLLDIGCGWGALVARAAAHFGAKATGITLSQVQCDEARRRIAREGLSGDANVELCDYRDLNGLAFDKIVSVGMFEHVGRANLREYFDAAFGALMPGGLFLNHGIANQHTASRRGEASGFMDRFIFPDGELVWIGDALSFAQAAGFEVRDVENLREHYTRTLRAWVSNIERNCQAAIAAAGEQSYRAWRLYMAGSAQGFRSGRIGLFQSLLARPKEDGSVSIPATRRDLYP